MSFLENFCLKVKFLLLLANPSKSKKVIVEKFTLSLSLIHSEVWKTRNVIATVLTFTKVLRNAKKKKKCLKEKYFFKRKTFFAFFENFAEKKATKQTKNT